MRSGRNTARRALLELRALLSALGPANVLRYLVAIVLSAPEVVRTGSLSPADGRMEERRYEFAVGGVKVTVPGEAFGLARELYARRVYLSEPRCEMPSEGLIVDVGANRGLFTALAALKGNQVLAIEGQEQFLPRIRELLNANRIPEGRVRTVCARLGGDALLKDEEYEPGELGPRTDLLRLIEAEGFDRIDFLKMDIEGSEFGALSSAWLMRTRKLAVEVHPAFGDPGELVRCLEDAGFAWAARTRDLQLAGTLPKKDVFYLHAWRAD